MECAAGPHLSKENLGDDAPEDHRGIVGKRALVGRERHLGGHG